MRQVVLCGKCRMNQEENNLFQKKSYYADRLNNIYSLVLGTSRNNSPYLISDKKRGFYQDILNAINNFDEEPVILSLNNNNNIQKKQQVYIAINQLRNELNNSSTRQEDIQIVREIAEEIASYRPEILTQAEPFPNIGYNFNQNFVYKEEPVLKKRGHNNIYDPPTNQELENLLAKMPKKTLKGGKKRAKKTHCLRRKKRNQRKTQRKRR